MLLLRHARCCMAVLSCTSITSACHECNLSTRSAGLEHGHVGCELSRPLIMGQSRGLETSCNKGSKAARDRANISQHLKRPADCSQSAACFRDHGSESPDLPCWLFRSTESMAEAHPALDFSVPARLACDGGTVFKGTCHAAVHIPSVPCLQLSDIQGSQGPQQHGASTPTS